MSPFAEIALILAGLYILFKVLNALIGADRVDLYTRSEFAYLGQCVAYKVWWGPGDYKIYEGKVQDVSDRYIKIDGV